MDKWLHPLKRVETLIARFMGPTWGPTGADRTQVGPILAPWTLLPGKQLFTCVPTSTAIWLNCRWSYYIDAKLHHADKKSGSRHQMLAFIRYRPLWWKSIGHRWIPLTKASDAELWCFLCSAPEQTVEQTIETPLSSTTSRSLWRHYNVEKWVPANEEISFCTAVTVCTNRRLISRDGLCLYAWWCWYWYLYECKKSTIRTLIVHIRCFALRMAYINIMQPLFGGSRYWFLC